MCVATWFAHKLAGHLLQRGRQFFVLRSSALRGGPNVFSFCGRPCTNSGTAFCRIVSAFSRHSAAGTCIDPDTVCVAVVSLWFSGDNTATQAVSGSMQVPAEIGRAYV